jgi:endonuclease/exonuclease/phosphatase family metal-dependent hydrolase
MTKQKIVIDTLEVQPNEMFRVATLNMLSSSVQLSERLEQLGLEIQKYDFDVITIQEFNHNNTDEIIAFFDSLGYNIFYINTPNTSISKGTPFSVATFTKYSEAIFTPINLDILDRPTEPVHALSVHIKFNGQDVHIINAHLAWGGSNEGIRLREVEKINSYIKNKILTHPHHVFVLVGDLNTTENSSTMRYLKGLQEGTQPHLGTYWVDAWDLHGNESNYVTSNPESYWGALTAAGKGLDTPSLVPKRRIDYILSHGWCYGKQGYPLNFNRFADKPTNPEISDHYGIWSDIYLPNKNF